MYAATIRCTIWVFVVLATPPMRALPPRDISVDFFQCATLTPRTERARTLEEMLDLIFRLAPESRSEVINGFPVRLNRLEQIEGYLVGELAKYRIYDPAIKGKTDGNTEAIVIREGESLVALTVFLYDPRTKVICLERNRLAVGPTSFCKYVGYKAMVSTSIELRPIIQEDALRSVMEMQTIRKLGFRIASWGNLGSAVRRTPAVSNAIKMAAELDAPTIYLEASMSHAKGSLDKRTIVQWVTQILGLSEEHPDSVSSLKVFGTEEGDDDLHAIDLLENRLYFTDMVSLSHDPDDLYQVRADLVRRAWNDKRAQIRRIVSE